jgi:hypothetical protein
VESVCLSFSVQAQEPWAPEIPAHVIRASDSIKFPEKWDNKK